MPALGRARREPLPGCGIQPDLPFSTAKYGMFSCNSAHPLLKQRSTMHERSAYDGVCMPVTSGCSPGLTTIKAAAGKAMPFILV